MSLNRIAYVFVLWWQSSRVTSFSPDSMYVDGPSWINDGINDMKANANYEWWSLRKEKKTAKIKVIFIIKRDFNAHISLYHHRIRDGPLLWFAHVHILFRQLIRINFVSSFHFFLFFLISLLSVKAVPCQIWKPFCWKPNADQIFKSPKKRPNWNLQWNT